MQDLETICHAVFKKLKMFNGQISIAICHMSDSGDLLVFFPSSFVSSCLPFQNYNQVIIFGLKHFQVKRNQNFDIDYHNYHPKANMGIIITYLLCAKIIDFIV